MLSLAAAQLAVAPTLVPPASRFGRLPPPPPKSVLEVVTQAAQAALGADGCYDEGRDRDGTWCTDEAKAAVEEACRGLRAQKKAWWLDAPRPLRAVTAAGDHFEVSIVCLPGGETLPPAAYPGGS
eukprot:6698754-Prymnesium_polylepis.1